MARDTHGKFRGLEEHDISTKDRVIRDDRSALAQIWDDIRAQHVFPFITIAGALIMVLIPMFWELLIIPLVLYVRSSQKRRLRDPGLPNILPFDSPLPKDYLLPVPGTNGKKHDKPDGDWFIGMCRSTGKQVWSRIKELKYHIMVLGTTGSGKTELLFNMIFASFCSGAASLLFTDPKADSKTISKTAWLAHRFGREDDLRFLNYVQPERKDITQLDYTATNSINPTQEGSGKEVSNILMSLMPKVEGGSNSSFADNAINLAKVVTDCLVELRDKEVIALSWEDFVDTATLGGCLNMARNEHLSERTRLEMQRFIYQVPGVDENKSIDEQSSRAHEQFGYIVSYLKRGMSTLTSVFGFIYDHRYGDVSFTDAVERGRIVGSMIPSLQNTEEDTSMLGKIDLSGKKQAMSKGLPTQQEGTNKSIKRQEIQTSGGASLNIMDEFRYIATPGIEITATQGRFLGIGSVFGGQSVAGFSAHSEEQKDEIIENTGVKFLGRSQGVATIKEMREIMGSEYVPETDGRTGENSEFAGVRDRWTMSYHQREIINPLDVKKQINGQWHMLADDRVIRLEALYVATPYDDKEYETPEIAATLFNNFIDLPYIPRNELNKTDSSITTLLRAIENRTLEEQMTSNEIDAICHIDANVEDQELATIMSLMDMTSLEIGDDEADYENHEADEDDGIKEISIDREEEACTEEAPIIDDMDYDKDLGEFYFATDQKEQIQRDLFTANMIDVTDQQTKEQEELEEAARMTEIATNDLLETLGEQAKSFDDVEHLQEALDLKEVLEEGVKVKRAHQSHAKYLAQVKEKERKLEDERRLQSNGAPIQATLDITSGQSYSEAKENQHKDDMRRVAREVLIQAKALKDKTKSEEENMIKHVMQQLEGIKKLKYEMDNNERMTMIKQMIKDILHEDNNKG